MKNVIITGATGMIGKLILNECINSDQIGSVISISRNSSGIQHEKLTEVIHNDFRDFSSISEHFTDKDICYYCIGVYTGQVPNEAFREITVDFTSAFADTLKQNSKNVNFCFLSGAGADSSENSRILFAREKGIAENILLRSGFENTFIFRPGYIYPVTPRKEPNLIYRIFRFLFKPIAFLYPNIGVTSEKLANKMFSTGLNGSDITIFENIDIRK